MMIGKIYAFVWLLVAAAAAVTYSLGYFNEPMLSVFGFIFSTLFFMGIVAVLPSLVDSHYSAEGRAG